MFGSMFSNRFFRDPWMSRGFFDMEDDFWPMDRNMNRQQPSVFDQDNFFTRSSNMQSNASEQSSGSQSSEQPQQRQHSRRQDVQPRSSYGGGWMDDWMDNADSSSYTCSSSSFTQTGADGKPTMSKSTRTERRRVGDLVEEHTVSNDHLGNERITTKRGLSNQMREVITDRNGSGAERKLENLRGIRPEEVDQFDKKWNEAAQRFDPQHKFLLQGQGQQQQQQAQLKAPQEEQVGTSHKASSDVGHEKKTTINKPTHAV